MNTECLGIEFCSSAHKNTLISWFWVRYGQLRSETINSVIIRSRSCLKSKNHMLKITENAQNEPEMDWDGQKQFWDNFQLIWCISGDFEHVVFRSDRRRACHYHLPSPFCPKSSFTDKQNQRKCNSWREESNSILNKFQVRDVQFSMVLDMWFFDLTPEPD